MVGEHVHPADMEMVSRAKFLQAVTEEVKRKPTVPIRRIFNAGRVQLLRQIQGEGDRPPVPGYLSVRSVMQRARAAVMPPIPATTDDIRIEGLWAETWGRDHVLLHQDNEWGLAVFAQRTT